LASQVGRALQRLKAHKYFDYAVDPNGQLQWSRRTEVIQAAQLALCVILRTEPPLLRVNTYFGCA